MYCTTTLYTYNGYIENFRLRKTDKQIERRKERNKEGNKK
jgi:hypothetical protein